MGKPIKIYAEHESLQYFKSQGSSQPKLARCPDVLAEFDYEVEYRLGKNTTAAEALSRITIDELSLGSMIDN